MDDGMCMLRESGTDMATPYNTKVIDTDYATYSINYWCDANSGYPRVWGFTRFRDFT